LEFHNHFFDVQPEIIKELQPEYLLVRKLEIDKDKNEKAPTMNSQETIAIKDKILALIKNSEGDGGMDVEEMIMKLQEASPDIINAEIKRMLEEGIIFEPRPGKVRWLG